MRAAKEISKRTPNVPVVMPTESVDAPPLSSVERKVESIVIGQLGVEDIESNYP